MLGMLMNKPDLFDPADDDLELPVGPQVAVPAPADEGPDNEDDKDKDETTTLYRGGTSDPAFGFAIALALSIGLTPMLPQNADLRYTLVWGALAGVSVAGWLLGTADRIRQEEPEDIAWGIGFGLLAGTSFLLFGSDVLSKAAHLIFPEMHAGTLLAYLIFVAPLAETLFFRGLLQRMLDFWIVGLLAGVWNVILFFPVMWADVLKAPAVAVVIAISLVSMNLLYSYVRERNGLAAAWLCQIVGLLMTVFIPFLWS